MSTWRTNNIYTLNYDDFYRIGNSYRSNGYTLVSFGEDFQIYVKDNHKVTIYIDAD